ncbi:MAG: hypothetical protein HDT30_12705 [Clostridiales bacterium]|nr:hypothetical protein [Clostridiales bacterium]
MKKISTMILAITLVVTSVNVNGVYAATKLKMSSSKITLTVGKEKTVKANKKVTWKTSNKKIVTVKKVTSKKAKLRAVKSGTCKITAKNGKSKAVIYVTVKKNKIPKPAVTKAPSTTLPIGTNVPIQNDVPSTIIPVRTNIPIQSKTPSTMTPEQTELPKDDIHTTDATNIIVKIVSSSAVNVKFSITNNSDSVLYFGNAYTLQKLVNGNWESVSPIVDNIATSAVGIGANPHTTGYWDVNWENCYGVMEDGKYRIVKEYTLDGKKYNILTEFYVGEVGIYMNNAKDITVEIVSSSAINARLSITNNSDTMLYFGNAYTLQKLVNGNWENVSPIIDNIATSAVGIGARSHTTGYWDGNWKNCYGVIEAGEYRIVKEYTLNGEKYNIAASFFVNET